jgi:hypothetical protein
LQLGKINVFWIESSADCHEVRAEAVSSELYFATIKPVAKFKHKIESRNHVSLPNVEGRDKLCVGASGNPNPNVAVVIRLILFGLEPMGFFNGDKSP